MIKKFKHNLESIFELNDAEIEEKSARVVPEEIIYISVGQLFPGKYQPRKIFDDKKLQELQDSIKQYGILQPLLVRESDYKNAYEIIAGERRLRAAKLAGLKFVPAISITVSDQDVAAFSLLENIQREDLNLIEEAKGYHRLLTEFNLTHKIIAKRLGKRRSTITNLLRLLQLPSNIQSYLEKKQIQQGHAKVLLSISDIGEQQAAAEKVIKEKLTIRQLESLIKFKSNNEDQLIPDGLKNYSENTDIVLMKRSLETKFRKITSMPCSVQYLPSKKGRLTIHFDSWEDIQEFIVKLEISQKG